MTKASQGSAHSFYIGDECLTFAYNTNLGARYTTIADAISHASNGEEILATSGAFTAGGDADYRGKSLALDATRGVILPSGSAITLANGSILSVIFLPQRIDSHALVTDHVELRSRSRLNEVTGSHGVSWS